MQFRVYRLVSGTIATYSLVGSSTNLAFTGSNLAINYVFTPFRVLAGDVLGLYTGDANGDPPCVILSNQDSVFLTRNNVSPVGTNGTFDDTFPTLLLNIQATLV